MRRPTGRAFLWFCFVNLALWLGLVAAHAATYAVPIIYAEGVYWTHVGLGHQDLLCIVDTGATYSQFNFEELAVDWKPESSDEIQDANGGVSRLWKGPVTLRLGSLVVPRVMVNAQTEHHSDCLIGQSVFQAFRYVTLDREHRYLYLGN